MNTSKFKITVLGLFNINWVKFIQIWFKLSQIWRLSNAANFDSSQFRRHLWAREVASIDFVLQKLEAVQMWQTNAILREVISHSRLAPDDFSLLFAFVLLSGTRAQHVFPDLTPIWRFIEDRGCLSIPRGRTRAAGILFVYGWSLLYFHGNAWNSSQFDIC